MNATKKTNRLKGFTLIELLVVVAIIALLISILLPSFAKARQAAAAAVCGSNNQQVALGIRMYQQDNGGWLPCPQPSGSLWSEAAWWVRKKDLWFYALTPKYIGNPNVYQCAGDPFRSRYDYEKPVTIGGEPRTDVSALACGYGMNYWLRHANPDGVRFPGGYLLNTDRWGGLYPSKTILLAEVGPDTELQQEDLYQTIAPDNNLGTPWRDGGRLIWDDGYRPGWADSTATWLTARHNGAINMLAVDGHIQRVNTRKHLRLGVFRDSRPYTATTDRNFGDCHGLDLRSRRYICRLCADGDAGANDFAVIKGNQGAFIPHYNFAKDGMYWFTGPLPVPN